MNLITDYYKGLTIKQVAEKNGVSYEYARKSLKDNGVIFRKKYASNLTNEEIRDILLLFDNATSIKEIARKYNISAPTISRLIKKHDRSPMASSTKYDDLRKISFNQIHKDIIIGMLLGDGCIYKDNILYKLSFGHYKKHEEYFHWLISNMSPFVQNWYTSIDKRGNSEMLQASTICHSEFSQYAELFYDEDRVKHVPENIADCLTPLALAVWICDDGNLNSVNMRICTQSFTYRENQILANALNKKFNITFVIKDFKYKNKLYYHLVANKENTQKLSNIIKSFIPNCMLYKVI